jgi:hypothetical protein
LRSVSRHFPSSVARLTFPSSAIFIPPPRRGTILPAWKELSMVEPAITPKVVQKHNLTPDEYGKVKEIRCENTVSRRVSFPGGPRAVLIFESPPAFRSRN